ncbi:hypothetical protein ACFXOQ_36405, partial [Streptomyces californicus]|uniref:hypothetical protein n=1 Tax=Streptomyces californicus TaxID=67351 RepID=UPI0036ADCB74
HDLVRPAEVRNEYDRYRIHHPLFAQVLRERGVANGPRWRRHHAKLLQILEAEQDWDDEMWVRATAVAVEARNRAKAGSLALQAARRQFTLGAVSKARDLARIAVEHTPSFGAHALLAECLSAGGDHVAGVDACVAALGLTESTTVDPSTLAHVRLLWARNLYAEVALCGPVQDSARCIELCDQVAVMSADPEVQSRAFGHRGLAHLTAYQPMEAEQWLQKAIDVAVAADHPYAEYEAVHWLSKKTMACMELERSAQLLAQLREMSQTSGVASENPPHVRDLSRVLGLLGEFPNAANAFAVFTDLSQVSAAGRVSTTLACQLSEIEWLHGSGAAAGFLDELCRAADEDFLMVESRELLRRLVDGLRMRPAIWDPVHYAISEFGVSDDDARAADAIFRFDVPSLAQLRAGLQ